MDLSGEVRRRAQRVRFLLMDVDGVLTDGRIIFLPGHEAEEVKAFDSKDGVGLRMASRAGLGLGLLSGRSSSAVARRARELGIAEVVMGVTAKLPAYLTLRDRLGLADEDFCYVGDDIVDVPVLRRVGLPATVADAHPEALRAAAVVSGRPGGRGAVREIVDGLLRAQGKWDEAVAPLLA